MKIFHANQSAALGVALLLSVAQIGSGPTKPISELKVERVEFFRFMTREKYQNRYPSPYSGHISLMLIGEGLDDGIVTNSMPEVRPTIYCGDVELGPSSHRGRNLLHMIMPSDEFEKCLDKTIALAGESFTRVGDGYVRNIGSLFPTGYSITRTRFENTPILTHDEYFEKSGQVLKTVGDPYLKAAIEAFERNKSEKEKEK